MEAKVAEVEKPVFWDGPLLIWMSLLSAAGAVFLFVKDDPFHGAVAIVSSALSAVGALWTYKRTGAL